MLFSTIEYKQDPETGRPQRRPATDAIDNGLLLVPSCPAQSTAAVSVHGVVPDNAMGVIAYGHRRLQWTALAAVEI